MPAPIAILTDFGSTDPFVGIMKGVIARIAPQVIPIDLTHEIPPGDILQAAVALWMSFAYFPAETVFLVVVDPGVGTHRRAVILQAAGQAGPGKPTFIGPDNGVFTFVAGDEYTAWELRSPALALPSPGATFHGRDIFAPAAAHAALGVQGEQFGPQVNPVVRLPAPLLHAPQAGILEGETLYPDRFGNLLTSLGRFERQEGGQLSWSKGLGQAQGVSPDAFDPHLTRLTLPNGVQLPFAATFGEIPPGQAAFILGSSGLIEIAANRQSAAQMLGLQRGERVRLELGELATDYEHGFHG